MAMGVQGLSKVGKVFESLQAIGRLLGPARTTAKRERSLLTTSDAIIACPDFHSLACCTQVAFTCWQGRTAGSQVLLLQGDSAFMKSQWEDFEGCCFFFSWRWTA